MTTATADREDLAEKASEFLLGVLERMGISADIDIKDDKDRTKPDRDAANEDFGRSP